jgi:hypothetical protein
MLKLLFYLVFCFTIWACNGDTAVTQSLGQAGEGWTLKFQPREDKSYQYVVINESEVQMIPYTVDVKAVTYKNRSEAAVVCQFKKDSNGNYLLQMRYDRMRLIYPGPKGETELDSERSGVSSDPL